MKGREAIRRSACMGMCILLLVYFARLVIGYTEYVVFHEHIAAVRIGYDNDEMFFVPADKFSRGYDADLPKQAECLVIGKSEFPLFELPPGAGTPVVSGRLYPATWSYLSIPRGSQALFDGPFKGYVVEYESNKYCTVIDKDIEYVEIEQ